MADTDNTSNDQPPEEADSLESLEDQPASLASDEAETPGASPGATPSEPALEASPPPSGKKSSRFSFRQLRQRLNIYLLMFGAVIVLAAGIIAVAYLESRQTSPNHSVQTQSLSKSALEQLASSDATVGSGGSILNVQSSAVFAGQVLIRQNLEIAGNLQIGGTVALNAITVAGASQFGQTTVNKNLSVAGDTAIQGAATVAKSLQVSGAGNFSGPLTAPQITTSHLQLNGDLALTHHITTGGAPPSRSGGAALGSGGSVSLSGSDTAGSMSINTGSGAAAGCFVTVNFTSPYASTPHVLVTPVGSAAGGLAYYINRSTTNFSICDATPPPAGSSFGFDYFVIN